MKVYILELWGDKELARKLGNKRGIAAKYFGGEALRRLCGSSFSYGAGQLSLGDAFSRGAAFFEECSDEIKDEAEVELYKIREMARSGHSRAASLALDCDHDADRAERYVLDARSLDARENYQGIESMIALYRNDAPEALNVLGEPRDVDAFNIRLALLIQTGRTDQILKDVKQADFAPNGETHRLVSIAGVWARNYETARRNADEALRLMPQSYLVRLQAAKVDYLSCILPSFSMWHNLEWPIPPDSEYLKSDAQSLRLLRRAEGEFHALLKDVEIEDPERCGIEAWRLACLACDPDRKVDASAYANQLLASNLTHVPAAVWAIQRGLEFDKERFFNALKNGA